MRTTYTEVPTARYLAANSGGGVCDRFFGGKEAFPPEKLASLYEDHDDYVQKVENLVEKLEREGWLLRADARAVREEAADASVP